jgi:excisionase family DNA binding protein
MDIDELASYLRLEKQTIYNWLHQKRISGIKVGRVWRFDRGAVDKWLASRVVKAAPENENHAKRGKRKYV